LPTTHQEPKIKSSVSAENLNRSDTWTILGVLLGVFFVIVLPPLYARMPIFVGVCIGLVWLSHKSHWVIRWSSARRIVLSGAVVIVCSVIAVPQFVTQWKLEHRSTRTFNVSGEFIENGMVVYGLALWNVQNDAVYPVGIAAYLRLENADSVSRMVDSIELQIQTEKGTWEPLETMEFGDFYYGNYPNLSLLRMKLLQGELADRNLQPGDHVSGWMFLDYPNNAQIASPDFAEYSKHVANPNMKLKPHEAVIFHGGDVAWETKVDPYVPKLEAKITDLHGKTTTVPVEMAPQRWPNQQPIVLAIEGAEKNFDTMPIKFLRLR
jgi:hypothetical protein